MNSTNTFNFNTSFRWNLSEEIANNLLRDITKILAEFSWVYNTRNTEIFVRNTLEKIPNEWVKAILPLSLNEFKQLPFGFIKEHWPASLKEFIVESHELAKLRFSKASLNLKEKSSLQSTVKNIPLKKQSEIAAMSNLVYQICKDVGCYKVLDVGSGLGYLDQYMHQNFGIQCIGIDSVKQLTDGAKDRLKKVISTNSIQHETLIVKYDEECMDKLQIILKNFHNIYTSRTMDCSSRSMDFQNDPIKNCNTSSFVMVGLHCCGNLMQDMMKIYCQMKELKAFVCLGCCYNKINLDDFPISQAGLKAISTIQEIFPEWYPSVSGLRLGSHATRADVKALTPDILLNRERSLIYRGIIEAYVISENINWRKPKRRTRTCDLVDFEKYCDIMFDCDKDVLSDSERNERKIKLTELYFSKEILFPKVRVLLILQMLLQPLWESFVILDRVLYFKEKSIFVDVCAVWDDSLSPRNIAIYACKN